MLNESERNALIETARHAIAIGLEQGHAPDIDTPHYPDSLRQHKASFVTLYIHAALRGCIGSLQAVRPLVVDVAHNAFAAAFQDPRFASVTPAEFKQLDYHISVLTAPTPIQFHDEKDLLIQLQPGVDGIVIEDKGHRATFLPQVWESLPDPTQFLRELKRKAGLSPEYWSETITVERYHVEEFKNGS